MRNNPNKEVGELPPPKSKRPLFAVPKPIPNTSGIYSDFKSMIQRQGLIVSAEELRKLADDFDKQTQDMKEQFGKDSIDKVSFQINIVNETGASDGWRIEE